MEVSKTPQRCGSLVLGTTGERRRDPRSASPTGQRGDRNQPTPRRGAPPGPSSAAPTPLDARIGGDGQGRPCARPLPPAVRCPAPGRLVQRGRVGVGVTGRRLAPQ